VLSCRQELVFIGPSMESDKIISSLNQCLLNDEEMLGGMDSWRLLENPFPDIQSYEESDNA